MENLPKITSSSSPTSRASESLIIPAASNNQKFFINDSLVKIELDHTNYATYEMGKLGRRKVLENFLDSFDIRKEVMNTLMMDFLVRECYGQVVHKFIQDSGTKLGVNLEGVRDRADIKRKILGDQAENAIYSIHRDKPQLAKQVMIEFIRAGEVNWAFDIGRRFYPNHVANYIKEGLGDSEQQSPSLTNADEAQDGLGDSEQESPSLTNADEAQDGIGEGEGSDEEVMDHAEDETRASTGQSVDWPKIFGKRVGSSIGYLTNLFGHATQELHSDEWLQCTLIAGTANGWLLFIKPDNRNFEYINSITYAEKQLPPLPDLYCNCIWKGDIYTEPDWPSHKITLMSYLDYREEHRQVWLTLSADLLKWVENYTPLEEGEHPVTTAGPVCFYYESDDEAWYGNIWIEDGSKLMVNSDSEGHIEQYGVGIFCANLPINLIVTDDDRFLYLYQEGQIHISFDLLEMQLCDDNVIIPDDKVLELYIVEGRRGFSVLRNVDMGHGGFPLYYYAHAAEYHCSAYIEGRCHHAVKCYEQSQNICECNLAWVMHSEEDEEVELS